MTLLLKYWKVVLIVVAILVIVWLVNSNRILQAEVIRQSNNLMNVTQDHERELTLNRSEYNRLNGDWKDKLDSVMKANKYKPKQVQAATVILTQYKDTGSTKVIYKDATPVSGGLFKISLVIEDKCWGMKGQILSIDPNAKLEVSEKSMINSMQLLVVRKKFLGFLWVMPKKTEFKGFTDCGTIDITEIDFIKE